MNETIELSYYKYLANEDKGLFIELINQTVITLEEFSANYQNNLMAKDLQKLRADIHKIKTSIKTLQLKKLEKLTEVGKNIASNQYDLNHRQKNAKQVKDIVQNIIVQLKKEIEATN